MLYDYEWMVWDNILHTKLVSKLHNAIFIDNPRSCLNPGPCRHIIYLKVTPVSRFYDVMTARRRVYCFTKYKDIRNNNDQKHMNSHNKHQHDEKKSGADLEGASGARPLFAVTCNIKKRYWRPRFILIIYTVGTPRLNIRVFGHIWEIHRNDVRIT